MSVKSSTSRAALLKIAGLVKPALATQDYIPALKHIKFDGLFATAYNDISAIAVKAEVDIKRCVPGDLLIRALGSFGGDSVALAYDEKNSSLLLSSGRSKLKLPTLNNDAFPFERPDELAPEVTVTPDMLKGIERCLLSVSNDPTHPAQMGVTLEVDGEGRAVLYSTDNFTISRYQCDDKIKLPGDSPVIMPTFFCEQMITLSKAHPGHEVVLVLMTGALQADFLQDGTQASLVSKTVVDLEPMEFPKIFKKHVPALNAAKDLLPIPDSFDAAFNRALLVLGDELDKSTEVDVGGGMIALTSSSGLGDAEDDIEFKSDKAMKFLIDPTLVVRASKITSKLLFLPKVLVMADDQGKFLHLVAHCSN